MQLALLLIIFAAFCTLRTRRAKNERTWISQPTRGHLIERTITTYQLNNMSLLNMSAIHEQYFIREPDITQHNSNNNNNNNKPSLVIFVQSCQINRRKRERIRSTWANRTYYGSTDRPFVLFTLGIESQCHCVLSDVENELLAENDVLLLAVDDNYDSLTMKGLLTMAWIERAFGTSVDYVIKTDDDVLMNTFLWMSVLRTPTFSAGGPFILGYVWQRPLVQRTGKYAVSVAEYPGRYYPAFCTGSGYAMSRDAVALVLSKTADVRFLKRDDPFITGLLAAEGRVPRYTFDRKSYVLYPKDFREYVTWTLTMLVHGADESTWHRIWNVYVQSSGRSSSYGSAVSVRFVTSDWFSTKGKHGYTINTKKERRGNGQK